jgi:hypothetical protein
MAKTLNKSFTPNTFITESGVTCHRLGSLESMFNLRPLSVEIVVGNNKTMESESLGNYKVLLSKKMDQNNLSS